MTTITDVAARAGVSMKTVSRVINGEAHVRAEVRERVQAAIMALDYRPNLAARQLAANRSFLISLIIHSNTNSYFSQLVVTAASECRRHRYHLVSETFDESERGEDVVQRVMANLRPDGVILPPPLCDDAAAVAAIERSGTALVRIAGTQPHYGTVIAVHERAIAREVVEHLIALGRRRIAYIAPPAEHGAAAERTLGYRDALTAAGIAHDKALVAPGDFTFASGAIAAERLLALPSPPDAVFAANDGMALGMMAVARERGIAIPESLAVAGFDDSPGSRMVYPALTTVRQPIADLARAAVLTLIGRADDVPSLDYQLIPRGSSAGGERLILTEKDA